MRIVVHVTGVCMAVAGAVFCLLSPLTLRLSASPPPGPQAAQQPPASAAPAPQNPATAPAIRATTSIVLVDAVVTDKPGKPVHGLPRDSFHILEDGTEQQIASFEEFIADTTPAAHPRPQLPPNVYTNHEEKPPNSAVNLLLLDALNTPMQDQALVRKQMVQYLKKIPPGTRIAIFGLSSRLHLLQGFTSDSSVLVAALNDKKALAYPSPLLEDSADQSLRDLIDSANAPATAANLESFMADVAAAKVDYRVQATITAFESLASYVSRVPGRKNLIWFSGSFPIIIDPAGENMRIYADQVRRIADRFAAGQIALYPIDARGLMTSPTLGTPGTGMPSSIRRSNPAYGTMQNQRLSQQTQEEYATMDELAQETGGQAYYEDNGLEEALAKAINNGSNYYTIAYVPTDKRWDGRFRKIQLKISGENYHLAYRRGYYADDPGAPAGQAANAAKPAMDLQHPAMQRGAPPSTQIIFDVRVVPREPQPAPGSPHPGAVNPKLKGTFQRYSIEYSISGPDLDFPATPDGIHHAKLDFATLCYDADGNSLSGNAQTFTLKLGPETYQQVRSSGAQFRQEIDLPVGAVFLRMGIHDQATDKTGSLEIPLVVARQLPPPSASGKTAPSHEGGN